MFVKALCILAVIFVGIGMVGIAIRRRGRRRLHRGHGG
jgi:NADH:ubiquinone oxidoreductase subunit K